MIEDRTVKAGRGVRQGDPLSPILFILALEEPLRALGHLSDFKLGGYPINAVAYADDLVVLANSGVELQKKLDWLGSGFKNAGLKINGKKSAAMTVVRDGRSKAMILTNHSYCVEGDNITPMGVNCVQRYLGLNFNWRGRISPKHPAELRIMLEELKAAPLKPHQRLTILKIYLVPKMVHSLVLGCAHRNSLKAMDRMIREGMDALAQRYTIGLPTCSYCEWRPRHPLSGDVHTPPAEGEVREAAGE